MGWAFRSVAASPTYGPGPFACFAVGFCGAALKLCRPRRCVISRGRNVQIDMDLFARPRGQTVRSSRGFFENNAHLVQPLGGFARGSGERRFWLHASLLQKKLTRNSMLICIKVQHPLGLGEGHAIATNR